MEKLKILVILGSIRKVRFGDKPAKWILEEAKKLPDVDVEMVDLRELQLPLFDAPGSPSHNDKKYDNPKVAAWAKKIDDADAYIIVSAEYNHSIPGALKDAMDHVFLEWNNKAVGFVSYGSVGGGRVVEHLRGVAGELMLADVRTAVHIPGDVVWPIIGGKAEWTQLTGDTLKHQADTMLSQLTLWGRAMKHARQG